MSFPRYGIAQESFSLAKTVLLLSTLGIFVKLLNADLSSPQLLGVGFTAHTSHLLPGLIGLALTYAYLALLVARAEAALDNSTDSSIAKRMKEWSESRFIVTMSVVLSPAIFVVYSMPYILGALGIYLLWADGIVVLSAIWHLAT